MAGDRKRPGRVAAASGKNPGIDRVLQAVLQSAAQAILTVDPAGRILTANPHTQAIFGYAAEELIGQPVEMLMPEAAREAHVRHRSGYFAAPHARPMGVGIDLWGVRKDGSRFPVEISLSTVETKGGRCAIAFVSDITVRKRLEEDLLQAQKMEAVGRLAGGVAHDFNNLMTIIIGYNHLLIDALPATDLLRGYAEETLKAAERAAALTRQLLTFSRRQVIQPRVTDLNRLLANTAKMLERLIAGNIKLEVAPQPGLWKVRVDPGQIEQVILNLALNARDALPAGGRITIETRNAQLDREYALTHLALQPGSYVMLAVSDNGVGMEAETRRRMFEPFFTTKPAEHGTGLGLATVYAIVKQNSGDIWVYSEPGKGTTFKIYLPVVAGDAGPFDDVPEKPVSDWRGTETVLVVEDEESVRKLTGRLLRSRGYSVLEAGGGPEAVQVAEGYLDRIDLLLTDVVMRGWGGPEVAERIAGARPEIRVIYASGYTESDFVHRGVAGTEVDFLAKPFTPDTLLAKVREVLDRR